MAANEQDLSELEKQLAFYAHILSVLHKDWQPHQGQINVGAALFRDNVRSIFVQCGRKWGKTEFAIYVLWRWAMMFPGLGCFYVAPELKQGKKILWEDPRLLSFGPQDWVVDVNQAETRIRLKNKSYLKVDGSDNFEAHRGTRPGILIYEEYKDHDPRFRTIMRPNLSVYDAPEIFIGTPPEKECEYDITAKEHQSHPKKLFYEAPTWENPSISKSWLLEEKKRLYLRGDGDVWEREYAAKNVKGGSQKIFSMLDRKIVLPHDEVYSMIKKDRKKLWWTWWNDPGTTSCFATLYVAINPYTKMVYVLDEIYEKQQSEMTVRQIGRRALQKRDELYDREWVGGYDEAEAWFAAEFFDHYGEMLTPSHKHLHDKVVGVTLLKDILLSEKMVISDRCPHFWWEMDNYFKDKNGNIPKKNDHLIDTMRYILGHHNYQLNEMTEYDESADEDFRGARPSDDFDRGDWNNGDYREI